MNHGEFIRLRWEYRLSKIRSELVGKQLGPSFCTFVSHKGRASLTCQCGADYTIGVEYLMKKKVHGPCKKCAHIIRHRGERGYKEHLLRQKFLQKWVG